MGIACHLAVHRAQAEPFGGIIAGCFKPPIIKHQRLGSAAFQKQLAIIRTCNGLAQDGKRGVAVEISLKWGECGLGHGGVSLILHEICALASV